MLKQHVQFVSHIFKHKLRVVVYGYRIGGIPFRTLLVHDLSKLSRSEYMPRFRRQIEQSIPDDDPSWLSVKDRHHARNPHHWQYWLCREGPRPMPEVYVREMIADWFAVEKGNAQSLQEWLLSEYPQMKLHPETVALMQRILIQCGITFSP